jgi:hypothetical protein
MCKIDSFDTGINSQLPPKIVCDTHSPLALQYCFLYIQPTSAASYIEGGGFIRAVVNIASNGELSLDSALIEGTASVAFLVDGGSYGEGAGAGQPPTSGFWLNTKRFSNTDDTEVRFLFDDAGVFNSGISSYANTYAAFTDVSNARMHPNVSSFDWNERIGRFTVVTAVDP